MHLPLHTGFIMPHTHCKAQLSQHRENLLWPSITLKDDRDTVAEKKHNIQRAFGAAQPVFYLVGCRVFSHSILSIHPIERAGKALMNQALSYIYR